MNSAGFVVDGYWRLLRSPWFRTRRAAIKTEVREEHANELAAARSFWQRASVKCKIESELYRRLKTITPSPYALWSS